MKNKLLFTVFSFLKIQSIYILYFVLFIFFIHLSMYYFKNPTFYNTLNISRFPLFFFSFFFLNFKSLPYFGKDMPLKSAVVTHIVWSRTSLWSWTRLSWGFRPTHRLLTRVVQHPLVIHIPLLLHLRLLSSMTKFNLLYGLYKLHFFRDTAWWATPFGISQPEFVWKMLLRWNNII